MHVQGDKVRSDPGTKDWHSTSDNKNTWIKVNEVDEECSVFELVKKIQS